MPNDFEDDGASFRVRRERQLRTVYGHSATGRMLRLATTCQDGREPPVIVRTVLMAVGLAGIAYLGLVATVGALAIWDNL